MFGVKSCGLLVVGYVWRLFGVVVFVVCGLGFWVLGFVGCALCVLG